MDRNAEIRHQIETVLNRNKDDAEFLHWAVLKLVVLERVIHDKR